MKENSKIVSNQKRFSEQEIESILEEQPEYIMFLYRWLHYSDFKGKECERLCEYLLNHFDIFDNIPKALAYAGESKKTDLGWEYKEYRSNTRVGKPIKPLPDSKLTRTGEHRRGENYLAMEIFKQGRKAGNIKNPDSIEKLGYILDYEMPIGGTKTLLNIKENSKYDKYDTRFQYGIYDPSAKDMLYSPGKCDLIAFQDGCFTILELKKENSIEPLIRAVLEAYTYLKMLDKKRAEKSFRKYYKDLFVSVGETKWKAAPLLYYVDGSQIKEYKKCSKLRELIHKLDVEPIWYIIKDGKIVIV